MKIKTKFGMIGLVFTSLAIGCLWGGSYLCNEVFNSEHWAHFPCAVTFIVIFAPSLVLGLASFGVAISKEEQ